MGGNTAEIQIGSERELCKYINHQSGKTKASTRIIQGLRTRAPGGPPSSVESASRVRGGVCA